MSHADLAAGLERDRHAPAGRRERIVRAAHDDAVAVALFVGLHPRSGDRSFTATIPLRLDNREPEVAGVAADAIGGAEALDAHALAVVDERGALVDRPALRREPGPDGVREPGQGPPLGGVDVDRERDEPEARVDGQLLEVLAGLLGADLAASPRRQPPTIAQRPAIAAPAEKPAKTMSGGSQSVPAATSAS